MINEYKAIMEVFKEGKEIVGAAKAKKFQLMGNAIAAFLTASFTIAQGFGYHIPVSNETIMTASSGIGSIWLIVNAIITVISSKKIGIKN